MGLAQKFHSTLEFPTVCSRRRKEADLIGAQRSPPPYVGGYFCCEISGLEWVGEAVCLAPQFKLLIHSVQPLPCEGAEFRRH